MNVTIDNYRTLNFDTIDIQEEWNMPAERERRIKGGKTKCINIENGRNCVSC